jgi:hypothetical protein
MSSFSFPGDKNKYGEVSNIQILLAMLKDDARREPSIRINPFKVTTYRKYGYIKSIVAQCKYCQSKMKFRGVRTETDHFKDEVRFSNDSSNTTPAYEKIVRITYKLVEFDNSHEHNKEHTSQEETKRRNYQRNELILDHYESLLRETSNPNHIKGQLKKKFNIGDR